MGEIKAGEFIVIELENQALVSKLTKTTDLEHIKREIRTTVKGLDRNLETIHGGFETAEDAKKHAEETLGYDLEKMREDSD